MSHGRIDVERFKTAIAAVPVPRAADGRIVLAVDVTCWLRPGAHTSPDRVLCHTYGRGKGLHPRLTHRTAWIGQHGTLPIIEGTVILLQVERQPSGATAKPVWLWWSNPTANTTEATLCWQAFLRRFDIEHTVRTLKQTLGWTRPKLRDPAAGDRWTWLIQAAYTQLRLARGAVADLRRPRERPAPPQRRTPARVRRGFRHLHAKAGNPATAPKPSRPGPAGHPASATTTQPPATTSTSPPARTRPAAQRNRTNQLPRGHAARVKTKLGEHPESYGGRDVVQGRLQSHPVAASTR